MPPTSTPGELAQTRAHARARLTGTATIQTLVTTSDGAGSTTESFATGVPIPARLAPAGGGETGPAGDRVDDRTTHILSFPAGTQITAADRVDMDGRAYEVTAVRRRTSEILTRVEAREL